MPAPSISKTPFLLLAEALRRGAAKLVESANHVEQDGIRIGLSDGAIQREVRALRDEAELIGEVFRIITGLAPVEGTIRAIVDIAA